MCTIELRYIEHGCKWHKAKSYKFIQTYNQFNESPFCDVKNINTCVYCLYLVECGLSLRQSFIFVVWIANSYSRYSLHSMYTYTRIYCLGFLVPSNLHNLQIKIFFVIQSLMEKYFPFVTIHSLIIFGV